MCIKRKQEEALDFFFLHISYYSFWTLMVSCSLCWHRQIFYSYFCCHSSFPPSFVLHVSVGKVNFIDGMCTIISCLLIAQNRMTATGDGTHHIYVNHFITSFHNLISNASAVDESLLYSFNPSLIHPLQSEHLFKYT